MRLPMGSRISDSNELSLVVNADCRGRDMLLSILHQTIAAKSLVKSRKIATYLDSFMFSLEHSFELLGLLVFSNAAEPVPQLMWIPLSMDGRLTNFCPLLPPVLDERSDSSGLWDDVRYLLLLLFSFSNSILKNFLLYSFLKGRSNIKQLHIRWIRAHLVIAPGRKKTPSWLLLVDEIEASEPILLAGLTPIGDTLSTEDWPEWRSMFALSLLSSSFSSSSTSSDWLFKRAHSRAVWFSLFLMLSAVWFHL